jgi:hypothetical protein
MCPDAIPKTSAPGEILGGFLPSLLGASKKNDAMTTQH